MLEWPERSEHGRRMDDCIEMAQLRFERARDIRKIVGARGGEIERQDARFGMTVTFDLVVERLKLSDDASVQYDRRAGRCASDRQYSAETARCARDEHDAIPQVGFRFVVWAGKGHGGTGKDVRR